MIKTQTKQNKTAKGTRVGSKRKTRGDDGADEDSAISLETVSERPRAKKAKVLALRGAKLVAARVVPTEERRAEEKRKRRHRKDEDDEDYEATTAGDSAAASDRKLRRTESGNGRSRRKDRERPKKEKEKKKNTGKDRKRRRDSSLGNDCLPLSDLPGEIIEAILEEVIAPSNHADDSGRVYTERDRVCALMCCRQTCTMLRAWVEASPWWRTALTGSPDVVTRDAGLTASLERLRLAARALSGNPLARTYADRADGTAIGGRGTLPAFDPPPVHPIAETRGTVRTIREAIARRGLSLARLDGLSQRGRADLLAERSRAPAPASDEERAAADAQDELWSLECAVLADAPRVADRVDTWRRYVELLLEEGVAHREDEEEGRGDAGPPDAGAVDDDPETESYSAFQLYWGVRALLAPPMVPSLGNARERTLFLCERPDPRPADADADADADAGAGAGAGAGARFVAVADLVRPGGGDAPPGRGSGAVGPPARREARVDPPGGAPRGARQLQQHPRVRGPLHRCPRQQGRPSDRDGADLRTGGGRSRWSAGETVAARGDRPGAQAPSAIRRRRRQGQGQGQGQGRGGFVGGPPSRAHPDLGRGPQATPAAGVRPGVRAQGLRPSVCSTHAAARSAGGVRRRPRGGRAEVRLDGGVSLVPVFLRLADRSRGTRRHLPPRQHDPAHRQPVRVGRRRGRRRPIARAPAEPDETGRVAAGPAALPRAPRRSQRRGTGLRDGPPEVLGRPRALHRAAQVGLPPLAVQREPRGHATAQVPAADRQREREEGRTRRGSGPRKGMGMGPRRGDRGGGHAGQHAQREGEGRGGQLRFGAVERRDRGQGPGRGVALPAAGPEGAVRDAGALPRSDRPDEGRGARSPHGQLGADGGLPARRGGDDLGVVLGGRSHQRAGSAVAGALGAAVAVGEPHRRTRRDGSRRPPRSR